tara:strand:- start:1342 stop:1650 length:309 start_codon:yes stop_codon:yes gene_type:complete
MARYKMKRYGTRAEVMHGKARMTQGRLKKEDLEYNPKGAIVSKKKSKLMKTKKNPLKKLGLLQNKKGVFGPREKRQIRNNFKNNNSKNNKVSKKKVRKNNKK